MLDTTLGDSIAGAESSTRVALGKGMVEIEVVNQSLSAPSHAPAKAKRSKKKPNWKPYVDNWARRTAIYEKAQQTTPFLTPTLLKRQEEASTEAGDRLTIQPARKTPALMIGDLTHRFLQTWQFGGETANLDEQLRSFIDGALPAEFVSHRAEIETELHEILDNYFRSKAYARTRRRQDPRPRSAAHHAMAGSDHGRRHRSHLREKRLALPGRL